MAQCDDLRLGGVLAASGITGGMSINGTAIGVTDWSGLFGHAGMTGAALEVNGRPGGFYGGDLLGRSRFPILNVEFHQEGPNGLLVEATGCDQLWENTDDFLELLADPAGNYLEVDLPDASKRFLKVTALDPAIITQPLSRRELSVPLVANWPYWREGGNQSTDTITAGDTITNAGRAVVYDAVLVFAGDGTFTNSTAGWSIQVIGSAGPVTVDLGNRTVVEGGLPANNRIRRTDRDWGWFLKGVNTVTSNVSVVVTWRIQY